jgi:hypothetical protein
MPDIMPLYIADYQDINVLIVKYVAGIIAG